MRRFSFSASLRARNLSFLTALYLSAPILLWTLTWLRAPWSRLLPLLIGAAWWKMRRELAADEVPSGLAPTISLKHFWLVFLPLGAFSFFSGVGGFGPQSADWEKGNSVFADLVRFPWPVRYASGNESVHLTYYLGFYLPAALVGKWCGWVAANAALQVWSLGGMALLAAWLCLFCGPKAPWAGAVFILFGGADWLGSQFLSVFQHFHTGLARPDLHNLGMPWSREWWIGRPYTWSYYANVTSMAWIPQQAVATWLGACLLLRPLGLESSSERGIDSADVMTFGLLPFWAPLGWLGCLPLVGMRMWLHFKARQKWPSRWICIAAATVFALISGYLLSRLRLPPGVAPGPGYHLEWTASRFLARDGWVYLASLFGFYGFEFALLGALILYLLRHQRQSMWPVLVAWNLLYLAALPLFQYGLFNDLLRSNLAPLAVLFFASLRALQVPKLPRSQWAKAGVWILFGFGAFHTGLYAREALRRVVKREVGLRPSLSAVPTLYWRYSFDPRQQLKTQYFGPDDSWFARTFLKPR